MRVLEIDWQGFLHALDVYRRLPPGARRLLVEVQPSQPIPNAAMGEWREALLDSGVMVPGLQGKNARVAPPFREFCRILRSLRRTRIFDSPSRDSFHDFVVEHLARPEVAAFYGRPIEFSYFRDYEDERKLYSRVCSANWLKRFLWAKHLEWEKPYQVQGTKPYFSSQEILQAAQTLVRDLARAEAPTPIAELQGPRPELFSAAIRAGMRYLLFFPVLWGEGLEPALGLWPGLARKLTGDAPKPPASVTAGESFHSTFLMDDMAALLAAHAVEPLRMRDTFGEEDEDEILGTVPEWVEQEFHFTEEDRISTAYTFLEHHGFLEQKGRRGRDFRVQVTESGSRWMGRGGKQRLQALLDELRGRLFADAVSGFLPSRIEMTGHSQLRKIAASVTACFAGLDADVFVRLREFLAYHSETDKTLAGILRQGKDAALWIGDSYLSAPSAEEIEEVWGVILADFLRLRLLPLGGVKVARDAGGAVCFALTGAGRYLLGAATDFPLDEGTPGRIVVQPNFDIVFLSPSPQAESEIAWFSERKGRRLGTLFKITKQSILTAAAAGLTPELVLETLRRHCSGELPANVEVEISGWFGQYRQVSVHPALLIHCADPETAARVFAVAGKHAARLTDTVLELRGDKLPASLLRKLQEMGIFPRS